ncbi:hypothetical protein K9O30_21450 [Clostridium bowmanii]|uniref:hypothetical protein n=1 Tax=Clostridium bowmanii TaxID=132925 RepID=UPI001C0E0206|nr:hypothetical protein [Clostridium bowmanii]MBU3192056.1 hypothetical protein [Clostridium bowmanii]MCA1076239.1 hypothetical protein [Clostridium bowmanii]
MKMCSSYLFYDNENHIWNFYVNDKMELMYNIMYDEDKWTKEYKIDNEVLDFNVDLDKDNKIYIIYSVRGGLIKYCIWEQNKWLGKNIYSYKGYEITELDVILIGNITHLFFIGRNNIKKAKCSLLHLCLNKGESQANTVAIVPFLKDVFAHYQVHYLNNGNLYLIFINRDENEVALNYTEYKNNKWSIVKRLYGITGDNVNFCTILQDDKINVMNLSTEGALNLLEHVTIESDGKMKSYKIHESNNIPKKFLMVEIRGVLFAIWTEGKEALASSYKNKWSVPFTYYTELDNEVTLYKYFSSSKKNNNIKCKYILGTKLPQINLLLPENTINKEPDVSIQIDKVQTSTSNSDINKNKLNVQEQSSVLLNANKTLEKKLIDLQMKYQQKIRNPQEIDDNFIKLTNLLGKSEEKLNIITEIQQRSIKELALMKTEKISTDIVIEELNNKLEQRSYDCEELDKQLISKDNIIEELKNRILESNNQVDVLKKQLSELNVQFVESKKQVHELNIENEELSQDLEYQKNIGIVDRILKKNLER